MHISFLVYLIRISRWGWNIFRNHQNTFFGSLARIFLETPLVSKKTLQGLLFPLFLSLIYCGNNDKDDRWWLACFSTYSVHIAMQRTLFAFSYLILAISSWHNIIIIPIFRMKKLKFKDVKWFAQGHKSSKWGNRNLNQEILTLELVCLNH